MENKNNSTIWWILGVIVVVIIIIIAVRAHKNGGLADYGTDNDTDSSVLEPTEDITAGSVNTPVTPGTTSTASLSYQAALAQYKAMRIQFDAACVATPSTVQTWKNGTNVMFDNRSANTLALHIGALGNVSIKPWGFKIVKLTGSPLPATLLIDCGARQNVTSVLLQK